MLLVLLVLTTRSALVYGTGGLYESYYQNHPYSSSSMTFFHDKDCTKTCHYIHNRKDNPGGVGISLLNLANFQDGQDVCGTCHTAASPSGLVTPFNDMWMVGEWLFPGSQQYQRSAHFASGTLWPGAPGSTSDYPPLVLTSFRGGCLNCHNPHAQPDPGSFPPNSKPFLSKAVAGIDLCRIRDAGQEINGIQGDSTGGYDSSRAEDLCCSCHDNDGPARDQDLSGNHEGVKEQFQRISHHPVNDAEQSSYPTDPEGSWKVECNVCHNPHLAEEKAVSGLLLCLPSDNTELWGQRLLEGMPLSGPAGKPLEYARPVGSLSPQEQVDYVSFCRACHSSRCQELPRGNDYQRLAHDPVPFLQDDCPSPINRHGMGTAMGTSAGSLKVPFSDLSEGYGKNLYLACTDCHEAHGSSNASLLRTQVNGQSGILAGSNGRWFEFCSACHNINEHENSGGEIQTVDCSRCHNHTSEYF